MYLPHLVLAALALRSPSTGTTKPLFPPWIPTDWMAQDDSIRGNGASFSKLDMLGPGGPVKFHGYLNYTALGGAGFASQRTVDAWPELDLSAYDELVLEIPCTDGKKYTLTMKDTVPPAGTNDKATISWNVDFQLPASASSTGQEVQQAVVLLKDLVPTFEGRPVNDSVPLNTAGIKRIAIMIRSFFGQQGGSYELQIKSLVARKSAESTSTEKAVTEIRNTKRWQ